MTKVFASDQEPLYSVPSPLYSASYGEPASAHADTVRSRHVVQSTLHRVKAGSPSGLRSQLGLHGVQKVSSLSISHFVFTGTIAVSTLNRTANSSPFEK